MRRFTIARRAFALFALFFGPIAICRADVTTTGDVTPDPITSWTSSTDGRVGNTGSGSVSITNGGTLSDRSLSVGYFSTGSVTISGASSTWQNAVQLDVGYYGSGTVTQNDGLVTANGTLNLGHEYGSGHGTYNLNGGTLGIGGLTAVAGHYTFNFNGGVLRADDSFTTTANATLSGTDTINTNGNSVTWSGVLSGGGELVKTGTGTLTLSGTNTYAGGTDVQAGTLEGTPSSIKGDLNVASGATVLFDGTGTTTYSSAITGGGTLAVPGAGPTYANTLLAAGLISPSTSTSTLTVRGNYANSSTSTTQIYVDSSSCGQLNVAGTAAVDGTLHVSGTTCTTNTKYTFLTAGNGVSGTYDSVIDDFALYDVSLTYEANDIYFMLTGSQRTFASVARTWDQLCMGVYLDVLSTTATGDLANIINELRSFDDDTLRATLDGVAGGFYCSVPSVVQDCYHTFMQTLQLRFQEQNRPWFNFFYSLSRLAQNSDDSLVYVCRHQGRLDDLRAKMKGWNTWVSGYGVGASIGGDGNASGIGYSTGGMIVGMDRYLDECTRVGFCGGYSSTSLNSSDSTSWGNIAGSQGAVFLQREFGLAYLSAIGAYGHNNNVVNRTINFGTVDRRASSDYGGNVYSTSLEAGRYCCTGSLLWQPFASLTYVGVQQDAFAEHGAGSLDLRGGSQNANSLRSQLGARAYTGFHTKAGRLVMLNASAAWRHELLDESNILDASFEGDLSGNSFTTAGVNVDRDVAILGPGLTYMLSEHCSISANYNLSFSKNYTAHNGVGGLRYNW